MIFSRKTIFQLVILGLFGTNANAISDGPLMPEYTSFEPADATESVNLQTGNLVYNLPILNVGGDYPMSLSYHAGIQPEQEASWVGLGWTLNAGAINRATVGYPDDWYAGICRSHIYDDSHDEKWWLQVGTPGGVLKAQFNSEEGLTGLSTAILRADFEWYGFKASASLDVGVGSMAGFQQNGTIGYEALSLSGYFGWNENDQWYGGAQAGVGLEGVTIGVGVDSRGGTFVGASYLGAPLFSLASTEGSSSLSVMGQSSVSRREHVGRYVLNTKDESHDYLIFNYSKTTAKWSMDTYVQESDYGYIYQGGNSTEATEIQASKYPMRYERIKKDGVLTTAQDAYVCNAQGLSGAFSAVALNRTFLKDGSGDNESGLFAGPLTPIAVDMSEHLAMRKENGEFIPIGDWTDYLNNCGKSFVHTNEIHNYSWNVILPSYFGRLFSDDNLLEDETLIEIHEESWPGNGCISSKRTERITLKQARENYSKNTSTGEITVIRNFAPWPNVLGFRITKLSFNYELPALGFTSATATALRTDIPGRTGILYNGANALSSPAQQARSCVQFRFADDPGKNAITLGSGQGKPIDYKEDDGSLVEWSPGSKKVIPVYEGSNGLLTGFRIIDRDGTAYEYMHPLFNYFEISYVTSSSEGIGSDKYSIYESFSPYAHSWLLTAVKGPDYVDRGPTGPDDDDFGFWVEFEYKGSDNTSSKSLRRWRTPYGGTSGQKNHPAPLKGVDPEEERLYTARYGIHEVSYLHRVMTRKQKAVFTTEDRLDGQQPNSEFNIGFLEVDYAQVVEMRGLDNSEFFPVNTFMPKYNVTTTGNPLYEVKFALSPKFSEVISNTNKELISDDDVLLKYRLKCTEASGADFYKTHTVTVGEARESHQIGLEHSDIYITGTTPVSETWMTLSKVDFNRLTINYGLLAEVINAGTSDGNKLQRLKKIDLYTRANGKIDEKLIKSLEFTYDYSLCPNTPNSNATEKDGAQAGKLTLRSVRTFGLGQFPLPATSFSYQSGLAGNPAYDAQKIDAWGFHSPTGTWDNKQVSQSHGDKVGVCWNLESIETPYGGNIEISYERDMHKGLCRERFTSSAYADQIGGMDLKIHNLSKATAVGQNPKITYFHVSSHDGSDIGQLMPGTKFLVKTKRGFELKDVFYRPISGDPAILYGYLGIYTILEIDNLNSTSKRITARGGFNPFDEEYIEGFNSENITKFEKTWIILNHASTCHSAEHVSTDYYMAVLPDETEYFGGDIRVKSLTFNEGVLGNTSITQEFMYENVDEVFQQSGATSGRTYRDADDHYTFGKYGEYHALVPNGTVPLYKRNFYKLDVLGPGPKVTYGAVTIQKAYNTGQTQMGKTVHQFYTTDDDAMIELSQYSDDNGMHWNVKSRGLIGKPKKTTICNASNKVVKSVAYEYLTSEELPDGNQIGRDYNVHYTSNHSESPVLHGYVTNDRNRAYLTKVTSTHDGVNETTRYSDWDMFSGDATETTLEYIGQENKTQKVRTVNKPAYLEYNGMESKNMLTQMYQTTTYGGGPPWKLLRSEATTWTQSSTLNPLMPAGIWFMNKRWQWQGPATEMDQADGPNLTDDPENNPNWLLVTRPLRLDSKTRVTEEYTAKQTLCRIYAPLYGPIGTVANATFKECGILTCDYDAGAPITYTKGYTPTGNDGENGWEYGLNSSVQSDKVELVTLPEENQLFSTKCLSVTDTYGPTRNFKIEPNTDYILSAWVRVKTGSANARLAADYRKLNSADTDGKFPFYLGDRLHSVTGSPATISAPATEEEEAWVYKELLIPATEDLKDKGDGWYTRVHVGFGGNEKGTAYVQDVRFYPTDALVTSTYYDQVHRKPRVTVDANGMPGRKVTYDGFGRPKFWQEAVFENGALTGWKKIQEREYHLVGIEEDGD